MGNCLDVNEVSNNNYSSSPRRRVRFGRRNNIVKGRPLSCEPIKWRCQGSISANQLNRKRDEFWDTAPAFEGRQEIWDALKAAAEALLKNDVELAQAIVNVANIIVPSGSLCECYDELGTRYQLPVYVLWDPVNLKEESVITTTPPPAQADTITSSEGDTHPVEGGNNNPSQETESTAEQPRRIRRPLAAYLTRKLRCLRVCRFTTRSSDAASDEASNDTEGGNGSSRRKRAPHRPTSTNSGGISVSQCENARCTCHAGEQLELRCRLSSGTDHTIQVPRLATVLQAKKELETASQWPLHRQRWFWMGKILPNRLRLIDCHIPKDFLIQVIVHSPYEPESTWLPQSQAKDDTDISCVPSTTVTSGNTTATAAAS